MKQKYLSPGGQQRKYIQSDIKIYICLYLNKLND